MLKFYRDTIEMVLIHLMHLKLRGVRNGQGLIRDVTNSPNNFSSAQNMLAAQIIGGSVSSRFDAPIIEIIETLTESLNQTHGKHHDSDLIEQIVKVLQLPFAGNTLSGKTLDQLRKALLLPDEYAGLVDRLNRRELSCAACKRTLQDGEMVSISADRGTNLVVCGICRSPEYIRCSGCHETLIEVQPKMKNALAKSGVCVNCASGGAHKAKESPRVANTMQAGRAMYEDIVFGRRPTPATARPTPITVRQAFDAPFTFTGVTQTAPPRNPDEIDEDADIVDTNVRNDDNGGPF